ncbi:hypothetical protein [Chitinolyticbacter meiyuanensis]|uniref:hypothetical protein n=1 Tax=Chitinolyticbacter meiyuanensis TaxID=682798 RepID=UPI0011E591D9|nr:hypothetical protein [Chitinolyticbacter meiyuanensis]
MKRFALGVLLSGLMLNAFAAETRYYEIHGSQTVGPEYCNQVWPGSQYNGLRMGFGGSYFISCIKY